MLHTRWIICFVLFGLVYISIACATIDDIGEDCPMSDLNANRNETVQQGDYPEVVEIDAIFPCDYLVCISTDGLPSYCSKECRTNEGCPSAFACKQIDTLGEFSDRRFCAWRVCRVAFECGDVNRYQCLLTGDVREDQGRCAFR